MEDKKKLEEIVEKAVKEHADVDVPVSECVYRYCTEHKIAEEIAEAAIAHEERQRALDAGIPESVVDGKTKLSDHFGQEYIDHKANKKTSRKNGLFKAQRERLIEFFDNQLDWCKEYYNNNDDFVSGYEFVLLDTLDLGKAKALIYPNGEHLNQANLVDICKNIGEIKRANSRLPDNALSFVNIDEIEVQISGISGEIDGKNVNDMFGELTRNMTEEAVKEAFDASKASDDCTLSDDCLYYRWEYSSAQIVVDEEKFEREALKLKGDSDD